MKARMIGQTTSVANRPHLVLFQNPGQAVSDGDGGSTHNWIPLVPPSSYVRIAPATAQDLERLAAGTVLSTATHIVIGPYHAQVSTMTRIVFGARVFSVTGVSDPEERHIETVCVCVELLDAAPVVDDSWMEDGWSE